jgi:hypothetical protein
LIPEPPMSMESVTGPVTCSTRPAREEARGAGGAAEAGLGIITTEF